MHSKPQAISVILASIFTIGILILFSLLQPTSKEHINEVKLQPQKELMKRQNSNGIWQDASTTALSSYAILKYLPYQNNTQNIETQKELDSWTNEEGYQVSVSNDTVPNSLDYLTQSTSLNTDFGGSSNISEYPSQTKFAYQFETSSETKSFYLLAFLEYYKNTENKTVSSNTFKNNIKNTINYTIQAIVNTQLPNGSWNNSIYETALALHALSQAIKYQAIYQDIYQDPYPISKNDTSVKHALEYLNACENNQGLGSALNISLVIIAFSDLGYDIEDKICYLIKLQKENGSFGDVETSTWAFLALSRSSSIQAKQSKEKLSLYLGNLNQDLLCDRELALVSIASSDSNTSFTHTNVEYTKEYSNNPYYIAVLLFFSLTFAISLFARLDSRDIFLGVRKEIFDYIREHPGEHLSAIMKEFNLSPSSVEYHLNVLEKNAQITCHKDSKFKRYYINGSGLRNTSESYKDIMAVLKNPTSRKVVQFLMVNNRSKQKELAVSLGLSPSTINWHANRLKECKIIEVKKIGKETFYEIKHRDVITKILSAISPDTA